MKKVNKLNNTLRYLYMYLLFTMRQRDLERVFFLELMILQITLRKTLRLFNKSRLLFNDVSATEARERLRRGISETLKTDFVYDTSSYYQ